MERRTLTAKTALLALSALVAGCHSGLGHGMTPEMFALFLVARLANAEGHYHDRFARYGSIEELENVNAGHFTQSVRTARRNGYEVRLELLGDKFVIRAIPHRGLRGELGHRRTFYADESGIVRQSWTSEDADQNSAIVR
jgi:hypothetical protein